MLKELKEVEKRIKRKKTQFMKTLSARYITEAKKMLKELNEVGLRINWRKTWFMKNAYCKDQGMELQSFPIAEASSFGRSMNMENDLKRNETRGKAAWCAFELLKEATNRLKDPMLRALLFHSAALPALCSAPETQHDTVATSALQTTHRVLEQSSKAKPTRSTYVGHCSSDMRTCLSS
ncbi:unnamed protein product [Strongylus vulgaris]|uniref:Reverse transcriptase domain-containing protein n=1 Tax=Strongylus vulgaris TaxID=40348 RepID=A0A3P7ICH1_STRVU|nr:unnamed protein product [Strongylus vulgaris]